MLEASIEALIDCCGGAEVLLSVESAVRCASFSQILEEILASPGTEAYMAK